MQEITVLSKINHPHIVTFVDCFFTSTHIYIVMELIEGTNLFSYFKRLWGQFTPSKRYRKASIDIPDHVLHSFYEKHKKILRKIIVQVDVSQTEPNKLEASALTPRSWSRSSTCTSGTSTTGTSSWTTSS